MVKGDVNKVTGNGHFVYGFELVDENGNIKMRYIETENEMSESELAAKHDEILREENS